MFVHSTLTPGPPGGGHCSSRMRNQQFPLPAWNFLTRNWILVCCCFKDRKLQAPGQRPWAAYRQSAGLPSWRVGRALWSRLQLYPQKPTEALIEFLCTRPTPDCHSQVSWGSGIGTGIFKSPDDFTALLGQGNYEVRKKREIRKIEEWEDIQSEIRESR